MKSPALDAAAAYTGELRECLRQLVAVYRFQQTTLRQFPLSPVEHMLAGGDWALEDAERLLAQDTGRIAEALWDNSTQINQIAYTLADYLVYVRTGVPRSPSGLVATEEDVDEALCALRHLTQEAHRLDALRRLDTPRDAGAPGA